MIWRLCILLAAHCYAAIALSSDAPAMETIIAGRGSMYACDNPVRMKTFIVGMFFGGESDDLKCDQIPDGTRIVADNVKRVNGFISGSGTANDFRKGMAFAFFGFAESIPPAGASSPTPPEPTKPAPTYVPPIPRSFKVVSPSDVRATPDKWKGRDIEFRNVNVYWVDDDDVRLITSDSLTVFARSVRGGEQFKDKCETAKEALSSKCRATIRFSYDVYDVDQPSGLMKRTVLVTFNAEFVAGGKK